MLRTTTVAARRFHLMALAHVEMRAQNLRAARASLGLTQEEVADRMHEIKTRRDPSGPPDKTTGRTRTSGCCSAWSWPASCWP